MGVVKSAILSAVPGCEVVKNEDIVPKIGAFEVTHEGQVKPSETPAKQ